MRAVDQGGRKSCGFLSRRLDFTQSVEVNGAMAKEMSEDLFDESSIQGDSDIEGGTSLTYKEFVSASKSGRLSGRRRIVLQTSCRSDDEDSPPQSKPERTVDVGVKYIAFPVTPRGRPSLSEPKGGISRKSSKATNCNSRKRTFESLDNEIPLTPNQSSGSLVKEMQDPQSQSQSLAKIEGFIQETNKLLRSVLKRVDSFEKQIHIFEKKIDETTSSSASTGSKSAHLRKKEVPDEVRV